MGKSSREEVKVGGQSSLMHAAVLDTTNQIANLPKTCIAKSITQEEHPTACSKEYGCMLKDATVGFVCIQIVCYLL